MKRCQEARLVSGLVREVHKRCVCFWHSLRVLPTRRCHYEGSVGWEEPLCRAAVPRSAQLAKSHQELEACLLRPCEIETDSRRQASARWPDAGVAARQLWMPVEQVLTRKPGVFVSARCERLDRLQCTHVGSREKGRGPGKGSRGEAYHAELGSAAIVAQKAPKGVLAHLSFCILVPM